MSNPLQSGALLVDRDGRPTAFFLRWLNELRTGSSVTSDDAIVLMSAVLNGAQGQIANLERRLAELESQPVVVQSARVQSEDRVIWQGR